MHCSISSTFTYLIDEMTKRSQANDIPIKSPPTQSAVYRDFVFNVTDQDDELKRWDYPQIHL